jgi:hypothetical protein
MSINNQLYLSTIHPLLTNCVVLPLFIMFRSLFSTTEEKKSLCMDDQHYESHTKKTYLVHAYDDQM